MNKQHTPGPWFLREHGHRSHPVFGNNHGYHINADDGTEDGKLIVWEQIDEADGRLIAAAPDLLALVEKLDTILRGMGPLYASGEVAAEVTSAIAKATGQ